MKNIYILFFVLTISLLNSCYEDKGNYEYKFIHDTKIEGIEESYTVMANVDKLIVKPIIKNYDKSHDIEYIWEITPGIVDKAYRDTISRELNIEIPAEFFPIGNRKLNFTMINNTLGGIKIFVNADLNITTRTTDGLYLFKEVNSNESDLDVIVANGDILTNLIKTEYGSHLQGKPRSLGLICGFSYLNKDGKNKKTCVIPILDNGDATIYQTDNLGVVRTLSNLFHRNPSSNAELLIFDGQGVAYIGEDGYRIQGLGATSGLIGDRQKLDELGYEFDCSYISYSGDPSFAFDKKNGRIVSINWQGIKVADIQPENEEDKDNIDTKNIKGNLFYMGNASLGGQLRYHYAIFDEGVGIPKKIYTFYGENQHAVVFKATIKEIPLSYNMNNAVLWGQNRKSGQNLYFVTKTNKPFIYNYINNHEEELTFKGIASDEIITYIDNIHSTSADSFNILGEFFDHLCVVTTKGGKYYVYYYKTVGGVPVGDPLNKYSGDGIVRKIQYIRSDVDIYSQNLSLPYFY